MIEPIDQSRQSNLLTIREYDSGGTTIQISAREFLPFKENGNRQEVLVLFLGWGPNEKAPSYDELAFSLADSFSRRVLLVNTKAENLVENSLYHEAEAVHLFLEKMNINSIILAGYSQGGAKAANLAVISQERSTVKPEALILLAPVGLDVQTPAHLLTAFAFDTVETIPRITTEKVIVKSKSSGEHDRIGKVRQSLRSAVDIVNGVAEEAVRNRADYPRRLAYEIKEMAQKNPRLKELKIPVILIQGKHDKPAGPKGDLAREDLVEKALKELFPQSPYVNRILASRAGNHDFVLLRSPQIAKVVNYLLKRQSRIHTPPIHTPEVI